MYYCSRCGEQNQEDATYCTHCGNKLKDDNAAPQTNNVIGKTTDPELQAEYNKSKAGIGVLMAMFLNVIGLVIGLVIYPAGTVARKTFLKSWIITMIINVIIGLVVGIAAGLYIAANVDKFPEWAAWLHANFI